MKYFLFQKLFIHLASPLLVSVFMVHPSSKLSASLYSIHILFTTKNTIRDCNCDSMFILVSKNLFLFYLLFLIKVAKSGDVLDKHPIFAKPSKMNFYGFQSAIWANPLSQDQKDHYSLIIRSRVTFATILAAAIDRLLLSPFIRLSLQNSLLANFIAQQ